ncbi:hypothetical protein VOI54_09745 [Tamlana sp. 2201CG12-4]|uniref:hypothetical protein n=1 Tax=Tamlana sp. 2201CG12-4 TaxID=3112582 RepID=UPI002DB938B4|nr:hypothetical protein [Tamlana sp. 2201CG12-4]MEC3907299.1 hypothetical protein [Tamlana sp. 2201CG12-4]
MSFAFKTQNVFRGLLPAKAPTLSTNAGVIWKDWIFGFYGGVDFEGRYQETDFLLIYRRPRINFHLEYYYNFTEGISDIPTPSGLFDFNKQTTRGLLDFIVNIKLDKEKRWTLSSSTIIFGRDTNLEERIVGNEIITVRTDQRYSQYLELKHAWLWDDNKVEAHFGGNFSWHDLSGSTFYGKSAGINNIGIAFTKKLEINDKVKVPVKASFYLNPQAEKSYLILTVNLIQLSKI